MDPNDFREFAKSTVEFIIDYLENIRERPVLPSVTPGYLHDLLPTEIPENAEKWPEIMNDLYSCILPGITNWQSPNFHSFFPTQTSYPSIIGEMISSSLAVIGFSWMSSPACTELEVIMMNWLGKFLDLPSEFLNCSDGPGGGVIQGSASEAVLVAILTAREQTVKRELAKDPDVAEEIIRGKLVCYSSDQSNSCVEKASILSAIPMTLIKSDSNGILKGDAFEEAIKTDLRNGKIPTICVATLGTTGTCAYDDLEELGPICRKYNIWLHVDAAYAGSALCCPEFRPLMKGIEWSDSFNFNLHKWMRVNFDACAMWLKNADSVVESFTVDRIYLEHKFQGQSKAPDYRHWQIPLGRRFRAMKIWIVLRTYGAEGIRAFIRNSISLGIRFENYVKSDNRFEIVAKPSMGLVCFRVKGDDKYTRKLLEKITERKIIFMIPCSMNDKLIIRFVVAGFEPNEKDIDFAWTEIQHCTDELFASVDKLESNESVMKMTSALPSAVSVEKSK